MKLKHYIDQQYEGNISAFARTQGVRYDQVTRWLKMGCIMIDGKVYCPKKIAK